MIINSFPPQNAFDGVTKIETVAIGTMSVDDSYEIPGISDEIKEMIVFSSNGMIGITNKSTSCMLGTGSKYGYLTLTYDAETKKNTVKYSNGSGISANYTNVQAIVFY